MGYFSPKIGGRNFFLSKSVSGIKQEGGGGIALVAQPLREELFFAASVTMLMDTKNHSPKKMTQPPYEAFGGHTIKYNTKTNHCRTGPPPPPSYTQKKMFFYMLP